MGVTTRFGGIHTVATMPPSGGQASSMPSPCRRAMRPTTKRPSTLVGVTSSRSASTRRTIHLLDPGGRNADATVDDLYDA